MRFSKYVDKKVKSQKGKTFVITGSTNGIGLALARQLVYLNAKVVMAVRNLEKAEIVKKDILSEFPNGDFEIIHYDQADFSSIEEFSRNIKDRNIDCLVLNAGIFHPKNDKVTTDGYPLTIGTNYVGIYYLCELLKDSFINNKIKRVVVTSSLVRVFGKTKHYEKYLYEVKNHPNRTYNVSKRFNYHFAANLKSKYPNLEVVLTHPGLARTNIIKADSSSFRTWFKYVGDKFLKLAANSSQKSALCSLISATNEDISELDFVYPRGPFRCVGLPHISRRSVKKIKNESLELASRKIIAN